MKWIHFISVIAAGIALPVEAQQSEVPTRRTIDREAFRASAREGMRALESKEYAKAQSAFAAAVAADPTDPRAAYNRGVAAYKSNDFPVAGESFAAAGSAGDASVAAASMYNQGTASFADALAMLAKESSGNGPKQPTDIKPVS